MPYVHGGVVVFILPSNAGNIVACIVDFLYVTGASHCANGF